VPCGKCIVVTSSHVDVSAHNLSYLYGTYGRIWVIVPIFMPPITHQLVIVEVCLFIVFFVFKEPNSPLLIVNRNSAWLRSCKVRQMSHFVKKLMRARYMFCVVSYIEDVHTFQGVFFAQSIISFHSFRV
jgi:hypothetical protein